MAALLKDVFAKKFINALAADLKKTYPKFDQQGFIKAICSPRILNSGAACFEHLWCRKEFIKVVIVLSAFNNTLVWTLLTSQ